MPLDDMNPRVRLSVRRALLARSQRRYGSSPLTGPIPSSFHVYHDSPLDPRIPEEMDAALTEVYADFVDDGYDVNIEFLRVDAP